MRHLAGASHRCACPSTVLSDDSGERHAMQGRSPRPFPLTSPWRTPSTRRGPLGRGNAGQGGTCGRGASALRANPRCPLPEWPTREGTPVSEFQRRPQLRSWPTRARDLPRSRSWSWCRPQLAHAREGPPSTRRAGRESTRVRVPEAPPASRAARRCSAQVRRRARGLPAMIRRGERRRVRVRVREGSQQPSVPSAAAASARVREGPPGRLWRR